MRAPRWLVLSVAVGIAAAAVVAIASWNRPAVRDRSVSAPAHEEIDEASRRLLEQALRAGDPPTGRRE